MIFMCDFRIDMPFDLIANFKSVRDNSFAIDFIAKRHETKWNGNGNEK